MAYAATQKFEELILDIEWTSGSGIYEAVCGLVDITISRTANIDTAEVPECSDESLPMQIERQVRSLELSISASGVWAQTSHSKLLTWWRSGATKNIRVRNTAVGSGEIEIESGAALLASLNNTRTKGQKVTAEIEIQMDGVGTTTNK